jgi:hypothetical protein
MGLGRSDLNPLDKLPGPVSGLGPKGPARPSSRGGN